LNIQVVGGRHKAGHDTARAGFNADWCDTPGPGSDLWFTSGPVHFVSTRQCQPPRPAHEASLDRWARVAATFALFAAFETNPAQGDDWSGLVGQLSKAGITPTLTYEGDGAANVAGGERRGTTYADDLHLRLRLDGDRLIGVPGLSAYVDGMWIGGGQPSKLVGDAQGVSSLAEPAALWLYEAWLQYDVPNTGFSILAGRYDINSEFYRLSSADLFLNSSFGIGPEFGLSGFNGPSIYPDTSLGVRVAYKPGPNIVLRGAVLDGAPLNQQNGSPNPFNPHDGVLMVAEAAWLTRPAVADGSSEPQLLIGRRSSRLSYDDKIAVGAWYYTARFDGFGPATQGGRPSQHHGEGGAYLLLDRLLFQSVTDPAWRVTGFVQLGLANPVVDRFGAYIGAGVVMSGLIPGRPRDKLGLAVAMARNGSSYIDAQQQAGLPVDAAETAIELSYLAPITSRFALQPDIQYVINPNADPRLHNATVGQLRFELKF
jgi:porin